MSGSIAVDPSDDSVTVKSGSPPWHRRLRRQRNKARRRIWVARSEGVFPRFVDLAFLASHHSRPLFKELMGGGRRKQWQQEEGAWRQSGGQGWQLWPGSYAASPKQAARPIPPQNLRYDQVQVKGLSKGGRMGNRTEVVEIPDEEATHMDGIQRALTLARKADGKVRKLKEEEELRRAQWKQYVLVMRNAFNKQHKQFEADLRRIGEERTNAASQGQAAAQSVTMIALRGTQMQVAEENPGPDAWDEMMISAEEQQMEPQGFLASAMQAAQLAQAPPTQSRLLAAPPAAAVTPQHCPSSAMPMTPQHQGWASPQEMTYGPAVPTDPYMTSPSMPAPPGLGAETPVRHGHRTRPQPYPAEGQAPRVPVHTVVPGMMHAADPTGVPLAEKLEHRRAHMAANGEGPGTGPTPQGSALRPFGRPAGPPPPDPRHADGQEQNQPAPEMQQRVPANIVDDDLDSSLSAG